MKISLPDLERFLNELWNLDDNKCIPEKDYSLNLQGRLRNTNTGRDVASGHLFDMFDDSIFKRPTYKLFYQLLDNYNMNTGEAEVITAEERRENNEFLDAILNTRVMRKLHEYLSTRRLVPSDNNGFKKELQRIWFDFYRRSNVRDSSGFEHVFVGEIKDHEVIGLHNWLQVYTQEKIGKLDYKGYFEHGTSNEGESPRIITIQFSLEDGSYKRIGSSFIGTSPEFEMAFFTALHFLEVEPKTEVTVAGYRIQLIHHRLAGNRIGTSFIQCLD